MSKTSSTVSLKARTTAATRAAKQRFLLSLAALAATASLTAPAQAGVVFSSDFESTRPAQIAGWDLEAMGSGSNGSFASYGFSGGQWLRNSGAFTTATLTLSGLASHTSISVDFLMALLDSFDSNDTFSVKIDGVTVFNMNMTNWSAGAPTVGTTLVRQKDLSGINLQPWSLDSGYDMASVAALHNIAHTASTAKIEFVAGFDEAKGNEGVAIDNLSVSVQGNDVPEPSTAALVGLALAGVALLGRRQH